MVLTDKAAVQPRSLKQLLNDWHSAVENTPNAHPPDYQGPDVQITHLTEKTSEAAPGSCFVARVRSGSDGHPYIGKAVAAGASVILASRSAAELELDLPDSVVYLQVEDTAVALSWLAAAWEGFPSRQLTVIGITGTDGKTSTANILFDVLKLAGFRVGLLSTIRAIIGGSEELLELHVTTPEAPVIQRHLRRMVESGMTHCILETTSHALAQHRVLTVDFDIAAVTNITHEHLDYHGGYAQYFAAKRRLFEMVSSGWPKPYKGFVDTVVLNRDDDSFKRLEAVPAAQQITYGFSDASDVYATDIRYAADRTRFTLNISDEESARQAAVASQLVGDFNVYNMLAAAAVAHRLGIKPEQIATGLASVDALDGRMQRISRGQPFLTIVDFAHTPNALQKAIQAARRMTDGRIIAIFGSAGKRDVAKRRFMAEISAQGADLTVLTAEDPRTESLADILEMMAQGCLAHGAVEGETFWRIPDRGKAIYFALSQARPEDLVLICGKGHEQSMCFGTTEHPWDDRDAASAALDAFLKGEPMPDLGLPTFNEQ